MENIFYKMIHALDDDLELKIDPSTKFILTFHKDFNDIGYTITVTDMFTKKQIHSNEYHQYEFDTLFDIFKKYTTKLPSMVMKLIYKSYKFIR